MSDFTAFANAKHHPFVLKAREDKIAILVHGFPGTPYEMRMVAGILQSQGYTSRGILLPGFGSDIENLNSVRREDWIGKVKEEISRANEITPDVILVGYSFGGALSINTLVDNPELNIRKLILIAPFWNVFGAYPFIIRLFGPLIWPIGRLFSPDFRVFDNVDFDDPETTEELVETFDGVDLDDPEVRKFIKQITIPFIIIDELYKIGRDGRKKIQNLEVPILVLQGTKDEVVPKRSTDKLVDNITSPHKYTQIDGAKHEFIKPDRENRSLIEDHIRQFIV